MRCALSFIIVLTLLIGGCVITIFILTASHGGCPSISFKCVEDHRCINKRYYCDGVPHCPNGSDENPLHCADMTNFGTFLKKNIETKPTNFSDTEEEICYVDHPNSCHCKAGYAVYCNHTDWNKLPSDILDVNTTRLVLNNVFNSRWKIRNQTLDTFQRLQTLALRGHNPALPFPWALFENNVGLRKLYLNENKIQSLKAGAFKKLTNLSHLHLDGNKMREINPKAFSGLEALRWLDLSNNSLCLHGFRFQGISTLEYLLLHDNVIEYTGPLMFRLLPKLHLLNLRNNKLNEIDPRTFRWNFDMMDLDLSGNLISSFHPETFSGLVNLTQLKLQGNPIQQLNSDLFVSNALLESLDITGVDIENVDLGIFSLLTKLNFVYFTDFNYCQYAPMVPNCRPVPEEPSSAKNLIDGLILRFFVWATAVTSICGNSVVLGNRWVRGKKNDILDILVNNLAGADLLMGIYLAAVSVKDIQFWNNYNGNDLDWNTSTSCLFLGLLGMISSEVSLFILTIMSLERYLVITGPSSYKKMNPKWALASMIIIWSSGVLLALTPLVTWRGRPSLYGTSGFCLSLHLHDPFSLGWEFSSFVFIGLNSTCLMLIAVFYGKLFWVIRKTRLSTPIVVKDMEMALRFFFMVVTDFFCWVPIIVLKLWVLKGYQITHGIHIWVTIFMFPLNSAVNPMLYTLSVGKIRGKIMGRFLGCVGRHGPDHSFDSQGGDLGLMGTLDGTEDTRCNYSQDSWK